VNFEEFIAIKGIKALGNQLTTDKIKTVNMLEPLPYEAPIIEEVEVNEEEIIDNKSGSDSENKNDKDTEGQITLF